MNELVIVITGASSGIGKSCAQHLRACGHVVYECSRRTATNRQPRTASHEPPDTNAPERTLYMNVDDDKSVADAIELIVTSHGRIDAVVNCAGFGIAGPAECIPLEAAYAQFNTNFFGIVRVCKAVLPHMRRQRRGVIFNISSLAGLGGLPFHSMYVASKFAVEGFSESLRMEVAQFGIQVILIEPGSFRTNFTKARQIFTCANNNDYSAVAEQAMRVFEQDELNGWHPDRIALLVARLLRKENASLRYQIGPALERIALTAKRLFPFSIYESLVLVHFRLKR